MVKPLQNVTFESSVTQVYFLVESKPDTKFQQLVLLKTAILEHP